MVEFCPSVRLTYSTAMGQSGLFMRVNAERRSFCSVNHLGFFQLVFILVFIYDRIPMGLMIPLVSTLLCFFVIYLFFSYNQHFYFTQKKRESNEKSDVTLWI